MNALMATGGAPLTMTSREIAELTGKRHDHVLRDIEGMLTVLGETSPQIWGDLPDGYGRPQRVAYLSKELTITLVSGYSIQMRHAIVCRWQELEARQVPTLPQTMAQALRLAAEQAEALEKQQAQLEAAKPKVEFVDQFVRANGSKGFREVCKLLNAKEAEFRLFLVERKVMYRLGQEWMPYQTHIDAGRFEIKAGVSHISEHAYNRAMFTPKGVQWVAAEWAKHRVALVVAGKAVAA